MAKALIYSRAKILKVIPGKSSVGYGDFILQNVTEGQADDITIYKTNPRWWIKKTKDKPVIKNFSGVIPRYSRDPDETYVDDAEEQEHLLINYVSVFIDKYLYEWRASLCLNSADGTLIQVIYKDRKVSGYILDLQIVQEKYKFASFTFNMLILSEETVEDIDIGQAGEDGFSFFRDANYEKEEWKSYILKSGGKEEDRFTNYFLILFTRKYTERLSVSTIGEYGNVRVVSFGSEPIQMTGSIVVDDYRRASDDYKQKPKGKIEVSEQEFINHYNEEFRGKGVSLSCGDELFAGVITKVSGKRQWKHGSIININMIEGR